MEREQELEWEAAQSTAISVDLVSAAKQQLKFLAAVDRNRWLYEGLGLDRAIYRYNAYWLPLLAKHSESQLLEGPLVVPLDCEWIWHCHRLNPVRYISDCKEFYGRILDNRNVVSSVDEISKGESEDIWKTLYPSEPYELDSTSALEANVYGSKLGGEKCTKYDLISAVQRQTPFFYQVSRPHMNDNRYLQGSVARYKGFLHLIKRNKERFIKSFSVPTYDIDLIWHTHQLHPVSYCKDLVRIMGKVLEHDDNDSDRTKGQKLDIGFSGTEKTFEAMYGCRYRRAGAMYLGQAPLPIRTTPYSGVVSKKVPISNANQKIRLPEMKILEVMLEFTGVRNLPEGHNGSLFVAFSKTQPDAVFNAKRSIQLFSESGEKQVASFYCQPTGDMLFELISKSSETMGTTSISLEDFLSPVSSLTVDKWLELVPSSNTIDSKPFGIRVAISVTIPTTAPYALRMIRSPLFPKNSCLFPLPMKVQFAKSRTDVVDEAGNSIMSLQMRDSKNSKGKIGSMRKEVVGTMESGEKCILAEFAESKWSIVNSPWSLQLPTKNNDDDHLLELSGPHTVRLFHGGRLDYESKYCQKHEHEHELEHHLMTAIEFSEEYPYGRAVALLDLKSSIVKVKEEWFILPSFIVTFILGSILRKEGRYNSYTMGFKTLNQKRSSHEVEMYAEAIKGSALMMPAKLGGNWNGKCDGSECAKTESGGCGGCGDMAKTGGCGGGCGGGGCGNMTKTGGCGGCGGACGGGGCGNMAKTGGCGGCGGCGGGCGNMAKTGGCGGCGGGYDNEHPNQAVIPENEIIVA